MADLEELIERSAIAIIRNNCPDGTSADRAVAHARQFDTHVWRDAQRAARAAISAYESAKQKGEAEGWVLVPREPTDEHLRAMLAVDEPATFRHHLRHPDNGPSMVRATELKIERARATYRAMLSAGGEGQ